MKIDGASVKASSRASPSSSSTSILPSVLIRSVLLYPVAFQRVPLSSVSFSKTLKIRNAWSRYPISNRIAMLIYSTPQTFVSFDIPR